MGILVQREFTVAMDDRAEFERQSRLGVWENMRHNGAQMIAFGTWAFGGDGDVVVTHSAYADFDHWTATRRWGDFAREPARVEETASIRAIYAGRPRLIAHSRAMMVEYDDQVSSPEVQWRRVGEPLAPRPPSFGQRSVVAETRFQPADGEGFFAATCESIWPWYVAQGARPLIYGTDLLGAPGNVITFVAFPDISRFQTLCSPDAAVAAAWTARNLNAPSQSTRLLMVATDYGMD